MGFNRAVIVVSFLLVVVCIEFVKAQAGDGPTCYEIQNGMDITPGANDIMGRKNYTARACCHLCDSRAECLAYVYDVPSGDCWLKSVTGPRNENKIAISGQSARGYVISGSCKKA